MLVQSEAALSWSCLPDVAVLVLGRKVGDHDEAALLQGEGGLEEASWLAKD